MPTALPPPTAHRHSPVKAAAGGGEGGGRRGREEARRVARSNTSREEGMGAGILDHRIREQQIPLFPPVPSKASPGCVIVKTVKAAVVRRFGGYWCVCVPFTCLQGVDQQSHGVGHLVGYSLSYASFRRELWPPPPRRFSKEPDRKPCCVAKASIQRRFALPPQLFSKGTEMISRTQQLVRFGTQLKHSEPAAGNGLTWACPAWRACGSRGEQEHGDRCHRSTSASEPPGAETQRNRISAGDRRGTLVQRSPAARHTTVQTPLGEGCPTPHVSRITEEHRPETQRCCPATSPPLTPRHPPSQPTTTVGTKARLDMRKKQIQYISLRDKGTVVESIRIPWRQRY
ncbi:hypothetical protein E2C01_050186 [Portunus trituberculatus]|uniref:Uncharacterized protein n=1 Tax=Portunus trituberculatus TaxID=210409 RepID=A0A5B7GFU9_PORTR|nr:hypothetical protein [Portunus trituberculatus]